MTPHSQTLSRHVHGVTLIELLITLVIVGILVTIAVPNYTSHVRKTNRSDATNTLMAIAAAQEKHYLKTNSYTGELEDLSITGTADGKYDLALALPAGGGFVATANAREGESQESDTDCASFSIDHTGRKLARNTAAADTTAKCW